MNSLFPRMNDLFQLTPFSDLIGFEGTQDVRSGITTYYDNNAFHVEAPLPGLKESEINVSLDKGVLCIEGKREEKNEDKKKKYLRKAAYHYKYYVNLPPDIKAESEPDARLDDGLLKISFPATTDYKPKKIAIKK